MWRIDVAFSILYNELKRAMTFFRTSLSSRASCSMYKVQVSVRYSRYILVQVLGTVQEKY
jgi:hypothetical protein